MRESANLQEPQISGSELARAAGFERHLHKNLQSLWGTWTLNWLKIIYISAFNRDKIIIVVRVIPRLRKFLFNNFPKTFVCRDVWTYRLITSFLKGSLIGDAFIYVCPCVGCGSVEKSHQRQNFEKKSFRK